MDWPFMLGFESSSKKVWLKVLLYQAGCAAVDFSYRGCEFVGADLARVVIFLSSQTKTKASVGFKAGVKEYKLTYYAPEYETEDTDISASFRVTPQPGVPPEEAGAAVAVESSTGVDRWTYQP
ncbi:hypothetical protein LIER_28376 [Lithospermum erythrorhizon]|uniref:Ribulose bisphosphate carboxylase large chain n=1 Tax=Lithospermum erythrorhizon TaxID=34254 RepID=A0AAV3RIY1_LITER